MNNDIVLQNELLEVAFHADTQVIITGDETFDVVLENASVVSIDSDYIEVLTLSEGRQGKDGKDGLPGKEGKRGPRGLRGNRFTIGEEPPQKPHKGDVWLPKGVGILQGESSGSGPQGEQGIPGPQGEQGIQGPPGKDGIDGEQGIPGPQGEQGIQGLPGVDGQAGPPGEQGIQGVPGERGLQGIQGERGLQGIQGERGLQGEVGPVGPGVPTGGSAGQKLQKASGTNYDATWVSVARPMVAATAAATSSATIAWSSNEVIRITLANASVSLTMSGAQDGQVCRLEVIQDATGGRGLVLGAQVGFSSDIPSYAVTTTANKRDYLEFIYNAGTAKYYLIRVVKGL